MIYQSDALSVARLDGDFAELRFDLAGESVNKFNQATVADLSAALDSLEAEQDLRGLLVTSGKPVFIVGADITEFTELFGAGSDDIAGFTGANNANFNRLQALPFPSVVAINGYAMGGGLEICLACDFRVMASAAKVGLPETKLGILPGWGGTARLPRIIGVDEAVTWITTGAEQRADSALKVGAVDAVVAADTLRGAALQMLADAADGRLDYAARRAAKESPLPMNDTEAMMAFFTMKALVGQQAGKNYPAPMKVVEVIEEARGLGLEDALAVEARGFAELATTPQAAALVGIFLGDQFLGKQARGWEKQADKAIERAAVLGAGIMGGGIAYQSAYKGIPIKMKDIAQAGLDLGLSEAGKLLSRRVAKGRMTPEKMGEVLNSIDPMLSYDGFDQVDIVVEAVVENPKVKHAVLAETEKQITEDTILASNTSTISISYLAEALERPQNFCGMHFFNPVHAMPLVEVIRGEQSSDAAIARTVAYANRMGKKAVVVKDCPGFLVNRVLFPYFDGFSKLLRDGADFQAVDKVMEKWGWPMGPAYLIDVVGIDTGVHAAGVMAEGFPRPHAARLQDRHGSDVRERPPRPEKRQGFLRLHPRQTRQATEDRIGYRLRTDRPGLRRAPRFRARRHHRPHDAAHGHGACPLPGREHRRQRRGSGHGPDLRHRLPALPRRRLPLAGHRRPALAGAAVGEICRPRQGLRTDRGHESQTRRRRNLLLSAASRKGE